MIDDPHGPIDYDEQGSGPTVVLAPGSCSTGAVWRSVMAEWKGRFRCITTSLLGYGGTAERRSTADTSIDREAEMLETVIRQAGRPVHLVGHSFGGTVGLAVALRRQVPLASLTILEAPAPEILRERGEHRLYRTFHRMFDSYFDDYLRGNREAIAVMIDFYGGAGTYAAWPQKARDYAARSTPTNILDWSSAFGFSLPEEALAALNLAVLVCVGEKSHPAVKRANDLLSLELSGRPATIIGGATHFMIATHPKEVGELIGRHIFSVETLRAA